MNPVNAAAFAPVVDPTAKVVNPPTFKGRGGGVGCWGDNCASLSVPMCALPVEDWKTKFGAGSNARGKRVKVTMTPAPAKGAAKSVVCELRDTLPHRANAGNVGIALNPAALIALGVTPGKPFRVAWEFEP